jgi:hypothetical protein
MESDLVQLGENPIRYTFAILLITLSGCSSLLRSRYAMDDPVYAQKYARGAARGDLLGKVKQALDARHTGGMGGLYASGGGQVRPGTGDAVYGAELGSEGYLTSWLTGRAALAGYYGDSEGFAGGEVGARLQTPSRIAPFVGVGTFQGFSRGVEIADDDGLDNDGDDRIDEKGEQNGTIDGFLSSIYPEVGVHTWIDGRWRVTTFGRYLITSWGRSQDDWMVGLQLTAFSRSVSDD